jgi:hypothetical protein
VCIEEVERFASTFRGPVGTRFRGQDKGGIGSENMIIAADTGYSCSEGDCWTGSSIAR